jgi:predicted RNA binding protein YcfA (HicA-like mRNA interferase family)
MKPRKVLEKVLTGSRNVRFADMQGLVEAYGFRLARVRGGHHIFTHPDVDELVNLQQVQGKPNRTRFVSSSSSLNAIIWYWVRTTPENREP